MPGLCFRPGAECSVVAVLEGGKVAWLSIDRLPLEEPLQCPSAKTVP